MLRDTKGTETTAGFIPHRRHPSGICCPVKLKMDGYRVALNCESIPYPEVSQDGRLVFALPGGRVWVP